MLYFLVVQFMMQVSVSIITCLKGQCFILFHFSYLFCVLNLQLFLNIAIMGELCFNVFSSYTLLFYNTLSTDNFLLDSAKNNYLLFYDIVYIDWLLFFRKQ